MRLAVREFGLLLESLDALGRFCRCVLLHHCLSKVTRSRIFTKLSMISKIIIASPVRVRILVLHQHSQRFLPRSPSCEPQLAAGGTTHSARMGESPSVPLIAALHSHPAPATSTSQTGTTPGQEKVRGRQSAIGKHGCGGLARHARARVLSRCPRHSQHARSATPAV